MVDIRDTSEHGGAFARIHGDIKRGEEAKSVEIKKFDSAVTTWATRANEKQMKAWEAGTNLADEVIEAIVKCPDRAYVTAFYNKSVKSGSEELRRRWRGMMGEAALQTAFNKWWGEGSVFRSVNMDKNGVDCATLTDAPEDTGCDFVVTGWQTKTSPDLDCRTLDFNDDELVLREVRDKDGTIREVKVSPSRMMQATWDEAARIVRESLGLDEDAEVREVVDDKGEVVKDQFEIYDEYADEGEEWKRIKVNVAYVGMPVQPIGGESGNEQMVKVSNGEWTTTGERGAEAKFKDKLRSMGLQIYK